MQMYSMLLGLDQFGGTGKTKLEKGTTYYPSSEWMLARKSKYNFIAKCGNNSEMHNHCDVGAFEINKDGVKIIADPGAAVYTYQYFNDLTETGRYSKKTLLASSWGHSVPIVNGKAQYGYGAWTVKEPYAGKVLHQDENRFTLDIAGVYQRGEVESLVVDYELCEDKVSVSYSAKGLKEGVTFRFVSEVKPVIDDGAVRLGEATLISKGGIVPKISNPDYLNKRTELYMIDFEVTSKGNVAEAFEIVID